jgi:hypothetical protein
MHAADQHLNSEAEHPSLQLSIAATMYLDVIVPAKSTTGGTRPSITSSSSHKQRSIRRTETEFATLIKPER